MGRLLKLLFSRLAIVAALMLVQVGVLVAALVYFGSSYAYFQAVSVALSIVAIIYIINQNISPAYKIAWILPIAFLPVFGIPLYILFAKKPLPERKKQRLLGMLRRYGEAMRSVHSDSVELASEDVDAAMQSRYLERSAFASVFTGTDTEFFSPGERLYEAMLDKLRGAKRYIFMEYYIIEPGVMWDSILEILKQKVLEGVDVRLMYDDMGCIITLPRNYRRQMERLGIKCCTFHRLQPVLTGTINNRDHRKICVIDGEYAFTGGVNLADEYINRVVRFGHWLDCGVMLHGPAAYSFALMYLSMWDDLRNMEDDPEEFLPAEGAFAGVQGQGYVQPYTDSPMDEELVGETAYINMLSRAKRSVYICTPYLVIGSELSRALESAAKGGVDVRMIVPGVPDKWFVYAVTRSYYGQLLRAGVRIYEYTPGFIHSKTMVCDGEYGICGTINLDYRSLYLHHECAVWMFRARAVEQMSRVFDETLARSAEVTLDAVRRRAWYRKIVQSLLRVFAPLLYAANGRGYLPAALSTVEFAETYNRKAGGL